MAQRGHDAMFKIVELHCNLGGIDGHGQQEGVFKRTTQTGCFFGGEPLLEQGGKRLFVKRTSGSFVGKRDVAVTLQGQTVEMHGTSGPTFVAEQFGHGYVLLLLVAAKLIIDTQHAIGQLGCCRLRSGAG